MWNLHQMEMLETEFLTWQFSLNTFHIFITVSVVSFWQHTLLSICKRHSCCYHIPKKKKTPGKLVDLNNRWHTIVFNCTESSDNKLKGAIYKHFTVKLTLKQISFSANWEVSSFFFLFVCIHFKKGGRGTVLVYNTNFLVPEPMWFCKVSKSSKQTLRWHLYFPHRLD